MSEWAPPWSGADPLPSLNPELNPENCDFADPVHSLTDSLRDVADSVRSIEISAPREPSHLAPLARPLPAIALEIQAH